MKPCLAGVLTVAVALYFWGAWYHRLQVHVEQTAVVVAMLEESGLQRVSVFPKSKGCYTWVGYREEWKQVTGSVCMEGAE